MEDGEPVAVGDVAAHAGGQVCVEAVPDRRNRPAELVAGALDEVAAFLPGEAFAPSGRLSGEGR